MHRLLTTADIGKLVRKERRRQGATQAELAGMSNVGITFISQLENGKETAEIGKVINVLFREYRSVWIESAHPAT